jgi:hypothetical protein
MSDKKVPGFEIGDKVILKSTKEYKLHVFEGVEAVVIGCFRKLKLKTKNGIVLTPRIEIVNKIIQNER